MKTSGWWRLVLVVLPFWTWWLWFHIDEGDVPWNRPSSAATFVILGLLLPPLLVSLGLASEPGQEAHWRRLPLQRRRWLPSLVRSGMFGAAIGVCLAFLLSEGLWGYAVRPILPEAIADAAELVHLNVISGSAFAGRAPGCKEINSVPVMGQDLGDRIRDGLDDWTYGGEGLELAALVKGGLDPLKATADAALHDDAIAQLAVGHHRAGPSCPAGVALQVRDDHGRGALVLVLESWIRGDTYQHEDLVFHPGSDGVWRLSANRAFEFDAAGEEVMQWPWLHGVLSTAGLLVALLVWLVVVTARALKAWVSSRRLLG